MSQLGNTLCKFRGKLNATCMTKHSFLSLPASVTSHAALSSIFSRIFSFLLGQLLKLVLIELGLCAIKAEQTRAWGLLNETRLLQLLHGRDWGIWRCKASVASHRKGGEIQMCLNLLYINVALPSQSLCIIVLDCFVEVMCWAKQASRWLNWSLLWKIIPARSGPRTAAHFINGWLFSENRSFLCLDPWMALNLFSWHRHRIQLLLIFQLRALFLQY